MPTYQYACTACDERLEAVQSFSDAPLTQCPACGGRLRKVFGAVGVVFKGSGFYKTDSRSTAKSGASDSGSTGTSTGDGAASASSPAAGSPSPGSSSSGTSSTASSSGGAAAPAAAAGKSA